MFQETENGGKRDEGVAAKGWELLVYLKIATRSRGQIGKI